LAAEPDDEDELDEVDEVDEVELEPPLDELLESEPEDDEVDEDDESEPLLVDSFTFSLEAPFPAERLSVL
jgi:hypothetical protein